MIQVWRARIGALSLTGFVLAIILGCALDVASSVSPTNEPDEPHRALSDTTPSDTTPSDTAISDTTPSDTPPSDTAISDTTPSDTAISDTPPSDTAISDTPPSDTAISDTPPSDRSTPELTSRSRILAAFKNIVIDPVQKISHRWSVFNWFGSWDGIDSQADILIISIGIAVAALCIVLISGILV